MLGSYPNWKLLDRFRLRLSRVRVHPKEPGRAGGPERLLLEEDYFSLILFGMLNPVIKTMRGLCSASHIDKVQKRVCGRPVSLGSFSEAQSAFDPQLLKNVFLELSRETGQPWGDPRLSGFKDHLKLVDGTLLPALPRMCWALWLDESNRAAKLHLKFNVLPQTACEALITTGNTCERKALLKFARKGEVIVGDRYYGLDYGYLRKLKDAGISPVMRIRNDARARVVEELPLDLADRKAGVTWQGMVKLGGKWEGDPIRVVRVEFNGKKILLATDLDIEAELVALIYQVSLANRAVFQMVEMHPEMSSPACGVEARGGDPDLLCADCSTHAPATRRQKADQTGNGVYRTLPDGIHRH